MDCCGYLLFAGPAARNLAKRMGRECVECCVRGSQRLRNKLAPKHACPCDLLAMMPPDGNYTDLLYYIQRSNEEIQYVASKATVKQEMRALFSESSLNCRGSLASKHLTLSISFSSMSRQLQTGSSSRIRSSGLRRIHSIYHPRFPVRAKIVFFSPLCCCIKERLCMGTVFTYENSTRRPF